MELTGKLKEAFNAQVTMELTAAAVYRQLSIDMEALDLPGIAGWFKAQSAEENACRYVAMASASSASSSTINTPMG